MILKEWLYRTGTTYKKLAEAIGCTQTHLNRIANGRAAASTRLAVRIEQFTKGNVSRDECLFPQKYTSFIDLLTYCPAAKGEKNEEATTN